MQSEQTQISKFQTFHPYLDRPELPLDPEYELFQRVKWKIGTEVYKVGTVIGLMFINAELGQQLSQGEGWRYYIQIPSQFDTELSEFMAPEVAVFPGCWLEPDYPLEEPEK